MTNPTDAPATRGKSYPYPFGATADDHGTNFAVWADGADAVDVCLFEEGGSESRIPLRERTSGVWHGYVAGVRHGTRYGFRAVGPWDPRAGRRFNSAKLLLDPYATAIAGSFSAEPAAFGYDLSAGPNVRDDRDSAPFVPKSVVVRDDFDWGDDRLLRTPWPDTSIYELHVRGFTRLHPGVPEHMRGTFAGLAHPAALEHLTSLGVTAVELMPVHHFVTEPVVSRRGLTNYWGYNSIGFFAPHAGYSSSGSLGEQVREFKAMVKALHQAGLEVILDVVYNHTAEGGETGPTLGLRGLDNSEYYRLDGGGGYVDYTGCGNTLRTTEPRSVQLVTDSLRYWVSEMHVDGFRFDLAPALARSDRDVDMKCALMIAIEQDPVLSQVKLIAEPWDLGPGGYQVGQFPRWWSEWNGKHRDTMRDFWRGRSAGVRDVAYRLSGSSDLYADDGRHPFSSVNFVTAHDGFTLHDLVSYSTKHNEANAERNVDGTNDNRSDNHGAEGETSDESILTARRRSARNLLTTLVLSLGTPMLLGGDEIGRTQAGNNNAYCQDSPTTWVDWSLEPWQQDLLTWTRALLELRRNEPAFRRHSFPRGFRTSTGTKDLAWLRPDGTELNDSDWFNTGDVTVGMYLSGELTGIDGVDGGPTDGHSFLVVVHAGADDVDYAVPGEPWGTSWSLLLDSAHERPLAEPLPYKSGDTLLLVSRSAVVLRADPQ
jgi:isoamylase